MKKLLSVKCDSYYNFNSMKNKMLTMTRISSFQSKREIIQVIGCQLWCVIVNKLLHYIKYRTKSFSLVKNVVWLFVMLNVKLGSQQFLVSKNNLVILIRVRFSILFPVPLGPNSSGYFLTFARNNASLIKRRKESIYFHKHL